MNIKEFNKCLSYAFDRPEDVEHEEEYTNLRSKLDKTEEIDISKMEEKIWKKIERHEVNVQFNEFDFKSLLEKLYFHFGPTGIFRSHPYVRSLSLAINLRAIGI